MFERFWAHVSPEPNTGCWVWTGALDQQGYGRLGVDRSAQRAHRVAYELFVGPIPSWGGYHGAEVCHRCDTPCCVNPAHLFIGTHLENMVDMLRKGRHARVGPRRRDAAELARLRLAAPEVAP